MRIALSAGESDEAIQFIKQLGLTDVVSGLAAPDKGVVDYESIMRRRDYFEAAGLHWDVVEGLPSNLYPCCMVGLPGRDEEIDRVCLTIENFGRAGIGVIQYTWMLLGTMRTEPNLTGRGGARYPRFDLAAAERSPTTALYGKSRADFGRLLDRDMSGEQVWDNLAYFLERVVPVAEAAGVKLAIHPDDPPIPSFVGVARIIVDWHALQRVIDTVPSPCNGLGFCMGTIGTMADVDVVEAIRHFGGQGRVFFAHFRNPRGRVPRFEEVFPDEGDIDMVAAMRAWKDVGFDGVIRVDHCPGVIGDNEQADRSFAYQVGYLKGLVQTVHAADPARRENR